MHWGYYIVIGTPFSWCQQVANLLPLGMLGGALGAGNGGPSTAQRGGASLAWSADSAPSFDEAAGCASMNALCSCYFDVAPNKKCHSSSAVASNWRPKRQVNAAALRERRTFTCFGERIVTSANKQQELQLVPLLHVAVYCREILQNVAAVGAGPVGWVEWVGGRVGAAPRSPSQYLIVIRSNRLRL